MDHVARLYVRASVVYLVLSALGGVYLAMDQSYPMQYRTAHSHLLLIGWVTLALAGALLARGGAPEMLSLAGFALVNVGLVAMTCAWIVDATLQLAWMRWAFAGAGTVELFGLFLTAAAIWMSDGRRAPGAVSTGDTAT